MTTGYLQNPAVNRIDHEYGALRLESQHNAPRYLPLRLLTRLVVTGPIDWSSQALGACMSAQIPIALLDGDGQKLGFITPATAPLTTFQNLSHSLLNLPIDADFSAWHRSRERFLMIKNLSNKRWHLNDLRSQTVWTQEYQDHERLRPKFNVDKTDREMRTLLEVWLHHELSSRGIDNSLLRKGDTHTDLHRALRDSLIWILRARYAQWHHNAGEQFRTEFAFENMAMRLNSALRKELDSLQKWIREAYYDNGH